MEKVGGMVGLKVWGGKIGGYSPPVESTRSATALTCCCLHHPPPPQQPHPGGEQEMWQLQPTANQRHTTTHHPPQQPHPGEDMEMWSILSTTNNRHNQKQTTTYNHPTPPPSSTTTTPRSSTWGDMEMCQLWPTNNIIPHHPSYIQQLKP